MRKLNVRALGAKQKQQLRLRIENNRQLKNDFDFLVEKTGLLPRQLLTGLWMDCNMMMADSQRLLKMEKREIWPISEGTIRGIIKSIRKLAPQIDTTDKTKLSPLHHPNIGNKFVGLADTLRAYGTELERRADIWAPYWERKRLRIPEQVVLTRQHSVFERIRVSAGSYHQTHLFRLITAARHVYGYPRITERAFKVWLNRLRKQMT